MTSVVNPFLSKGEFSSHVRPRLKKDDLYKKIFKNSWPVINIPFLSKVIEKVAATQTYNYLETYKLMPTMHSAYRKHHSEMTLLCVMNEVLRSPPRCRISTPRFLSGVWHNWPCDSGRKARALLRFLKTDTESGSDPTTMKTAGNQFMIIGDQVSTPRALCYEVPQGSILGELLSTQYMPLQDAIARHNLETLFYADVTQLNIYIEYPAISFRVWLTSKFV